MFGVGNRGRQRTVIAVLVGAFALPASAQAALPGTQATASIVGGSLTMVVPSSVAFHATLTGAEQTVTATQALDVLDRTGSAAGWNVTATSTTFKAGGTALPTSAVNVMSAPTVTCDLVNSCSLATTNVAYPYTLPAADVAPAATKLLNAVAASGLGDQTAVVTMRLTIPATATAGAYTSTWTYSLASAP